MLVFPDLTPQPSHYLQSCTFNGEVFQKKKTPTNQEMKASASASFILVSRCLESWDWSPILLPKCPMAALSYSQSKSARRNRRIMKSIYENKPRTQETNSTIRQQTQSKTFLAILKSIYLAMLEACSWSAAKGWM